MALIENTNDLRKEPRKRTRKGGRIVCPEASMSYDCQIRDLSESGARIEINQWCSFPKNIIIEIGRLDLVEAIYEVEVVWTDARNLGVKFLHQLSQNKVQNPYMHTVH